MLKNAIKSADYYSDKRKRKHSPWSFIRDLFNSVETSCGASVMAVFHHVYPCPVRHCPDRRSFGGILLLLQIFSLFVVLLLTMPAAAIDEKKVDKPVPEAGLDAGGGNGLNGEDKVTVDPFEPLNRVIFKFNDKLYFWVLKPVAKGYSEFVPEWGRIRVRNVFTNLGAPIRFVNSLLQLKPKGAARELAHFVMNSTLGIGGMFEIPWDSTEPKVSEEDLCQTLGSYGVGEGFYIVLPVLGPKNLRDTVGYAGDIFLDPISYVNPLSASLEIRTYDRVNGTSLRIGDYEDLIESALDPYIAVKDAYTQHRRSKIKE